jgi:hypothetical protein
MKKRAKLTKFFYILVVYLLVFALVSAPPVFSQVYEITEEELQQIEANQQQILQEAQAWQERSKLWETQAQKAKQELTELNQQLQTQTELYRKSENEKKALIKYGLPAAGVCILAAFFCGLAAGGGQ